MNTTRTPLALGPEHQRLVRAAAALLRYARSQGHQHSLHRSLQHLELGPRGLLEALGIGAALTLAVWLAQPVLMSSWERLILWWAERLHVPLMITEEGLLREWTLLAEAGSLVPGPVTGVLTAAAVMGAFAGTYWLKDHLTPLKYLVRTICVVQASALLFFMFVPSLFPYTVGGHLSAMLASGYYLMLALPVLLALGYAVLRLPLARKALEPALMLLYFALMLPHKALLHVVVLQHFSVLFMPLLYLCFGLVFDLMLFVALYSWIVSRVPREAVEVQ